MNVFASGHRNQPWVWQVTGLCFILGLLLASSLQTVRKISRAGGPVRIGMSGAAPPAVRTDVLRQRDQEIERLRSQVSDLETTMGKNTGQTKALNDDLQKAKVLAGLTPVHGPGVVVTLQDSKKKAPSARTLDALTGIVHDSDLQMVVNELGQSGAEAIAINDQRVVARTAIRCVGPTIQVNSVPLAPPYVIEAIGDPQTLYGGLNMPLGALDGIRRYDPDMAKIEKRNDMTLPAYTGSTEVRFAQLMREHDRQMEGSKNR